MMSEDDAQKFHFGEVSSLQLHADLRVYPKFWGYQVFIYSGYCSCHCRLPSEESTSGIPLI